jgi:2-polyprenyl-6-methoxyphenol hydroxylase-like FAD-dependent oxidoreductase
MLALLLARQGIEVTLLEEHLDFARDFRGDTVHPSTMEILAQLGLADRILQLEHTRAPALVIESPQGIIGTVGFQHLKTRFPYIALIPQVHFLECLSAGAQIYPGFRLVMGARAEELLVQDGNVCGVRYRARDGWHELHATLTVGADGRFSRIRKLAGFTPHATSQPMDVLWFRLPRLAADPEKAGARLSVGQGHLFVQLNRGDHWQIGYTILKGSYQEIKAAGLACLRAQLAELVPAFADRLHTLNAWKQFAVLSVESSMLKRWYRPGLLLIGDAAHVMTPVGGVGINFAIQDAVAAANILTPGLKDGRVSASNLARVQRRRQGPTKLIQAFQRLMQRQIRAATTQGRRPSLILRLVLHTPLRTLPARLIAFGPRRERVMHI